MADYWPCDCSAPDGSGTFQPGANSRCQPEVLLSRIYRSALPGVALSPRPSDGLLHWRMHWEETNNESPLVFEPPEKCAFGAHVCRLAFAEQGNVLGCLVGSNSGMTGETLELFEWPTGRPLSK